MVPKGTKTAAVVESVDVEALLMKSNSVNHRKNHSKDNPQAKSTNHLWLLAACALVALPLVFSKNLRSSILDFGSFYAKAQHWHKIAMLHINRNAEDMEAKTTRIRSAAECVPIHVQNVDRIEILYQFCSKAAFEADGKSVKLTENFTVPKSLARRFNFWRRIYSLWGMEQYVLHSAEYPEVVLEIYDSSRLSKKWNEHKRYQVVKKVSKRQKAHYQKILHKMHKQRKTPEKYTTIMRRIAFNMSHIQDGSKYLKAASSLRIQKGQRDYIAQGLERAPRYLSSIEDEFKKQGIPEEIAVLCFVESSFNLKAVSKVGASGIFQIMPSTGRQYLHVGRGIDERNDPIKAAYAAAKLLRFNYRMTQSWPLAITGYNHGVNSVKRAVKLHKTKDLAVLIKKYKSRSFGFASKNFYSSFLAALATISEKDILFPEIGVSPPLVYKQIRLKKPWSVARVRKVYQVTRQDIADYNPDISGWFLRANGTLPRGFVLKLPMRQAEQPKTIKAPNS